MRLEYINDKTIRVWLCNTNQSKYKYKYIMDDIEVHTSAC